MSTERSVRSHPRAINPFAQLSALLGFMAAALILIPVVALILRFVTSDSLSGATVTQLWADEGTRRMLLTTLGVVLGATLVATAVGTTFAWLNERTDARIGWLSQVLPILPLTVPPLAGTIGWILLATPGPGFLNAGIRAALRLVGIDLGSDGPLNIYSWYGLIFIYVLYLVPHVYLTVSAALRTLDTSLEEASQVCGASSWKTLRRVTLPAIAPSIAGAVLLALVIGIALFSVPILVGSPAGIDILSVEIVRSVITQFPPDFETAIVLGGVMVILIGTAVALQKRLQRAGQYATIGGRGAKASSIVRLGRWRSVARFTMLGYLVSTSVLPLFALIVVSLQPFWRPVIDVGVLDLENYVNLLSDTYTKTALRNSVILGVGGATLGMAIASVVAYYVRNRTHRVASSVDSAMKLPGALSHVVLAMGFVAAYVGPPFRLGGSLLLLLGAYLAMYMPQANVTSTSALFRIDSAMLEASRSCAASEGKTYRRIALPLMKPGLIVGWMFLFVLMAGDVTASVMLASTRTPVVGFVMLDLFHNGTYPRLAAMGVVISGLASLVIGLVHLLLARRRTRSTATIEHQGDPSVADVGVEAWTG